MGKNILTILRLFFLFTKTFEVRKLLKDKSNNGGGGGGGQKCRILSDAKYRDSIRRNIIICIYPHDLDKHPLTIVNMGMAR